jgi:hypothetical protein
VLREQGFTEVEAPAPPPRELPELPPTAAGPTARPPPARALCRMLEARRARFEVSPGFVDVFLA